MYKLTLTRDERKTIDWVGHRYSNGYDLKAILNHDDTEYSGWNTSCAWDANVDLTFSIPEYLAWEIAENAANEDGDLPYNFPCFCEELTIKMLEFCENII